MLESLFEANFVADEFAALAHGATTYAVWFHYLPFFMSPAFHLEQLGGGVVTGFLLQFGVFMFHESKNLVYFGRHGIGISIIVV